MTQITCIPLILKERNMLSYLINKVGKTIRPFRYDLNQIPNDYKVEVTNRFKGLDLIERVPEELRTKVHDIVQEAMIKIILKKKKCKKAKQLSEEALQIAEERKEDRKSTRLNSSHSGQSRMPSSA